MSTVNWDEVGPELAIELQQALVQMEMAQECLCEGRNDEALLHVSAMMRSKRNALKRAGVEIE